MTVLEVISYGQYDVDLCKKTFNDKDKMDNCMALDVK